jgi:hypothetical protein
MKQLENIIIYILILLIGFYYIKKRKEKFVVQYPPYYPITTDINPKYNNYNNSIEDSRLNILKNSLKKVRISSNDGSEKFKIFNQINLPVIKNNLELNDIKPVIDFILNKTNNELGNSHTLIIDDVIDIHKYETESEVKINFRLICQFKIRTNDTNTFVKQEYTNKSNENKLIILVELLSKRNYDDENIYINYIQISGLTGGKHLPGKNYYDNANVFLFSDYKSENIIKNKQNINAEEVNNQNRNIPEDNILEDNMILNDITMDDSNNESIINTEEAESFFNL